MVSKSIMISVLILFFSFFVGCATQAKISTELTEEQLWAIALSGIMTELNNDTHLTLKSRYFSGKKIYLEVLKRDWEINNKDELLETLDSLEKGGHTASFNLIKKLIIEDKGDIEKILEKYQLEDYEINRLMFTLANWHIYENMTIRSWDFGRSIALCRWGYDVGFLTEKEAWEKIMYYAKQIQPLYGSWDEYGFSYFGGRLFWASSAGSVVDDYITKTSEVYNRLISESGYWHSLRWDIKL